jgi:hypothetical protein
LVESVISHLRVRYLFLPLIADPGNPQPRLDRDTFF